MNRRRQGVALALLGMLVLLGTLAHASPPDPTWIGGLWDDADFDDVVNRVTSGLSTVESLSSTEARPSWLCVSPAVADTEALCSIRLRSPDSRAPPLKLA
jgi:hypothetical protein